MNLIKFVFHQPYPSDHNELKVDTADLYCKNFDADRVFDILMSDLQIEGVTELMIFHDFGCHTILAIAMPDSKAVYLKSLKSDYFRKTFLNDQMLFNQRRGKILGFIRGSIGYIPYLNIV